jgi:hypothetical protein
MKLVVALLVLVSGCSSAVDVDETESEATPQAAEPCTVITDTERHCGPQDVRTDCAAEQAEAELALDGCRAPLERFEVEGACCCPSVDAAGNGCQPYPDAVLEDGTLVWTCPACS